nr:MAG TPA: hypothetical protein [Caudoviricetes sp.]
MRGSRERFRFRQLRSTAQAPPRTPRGRPVQSRAHRTELGWRGR